MVATVSRSWVLAGLLVLSSKAGESADSPSLHLLWSDPHRLLNFDWSRVGTELRRLFQKEGIAVTLSRGGAASGIRVVLVRTEPKQWGLPATAMGAILSRTGPQTEVYVFFPAVVRVLDYRPEALSERWPTMREERALSRAIARVIAHEVIHAVLPERAHDLVGLTRRTLDRTSLLSTAFEMESATAEALRAALHRGALGVGAPSESAQQ